MRAHRAPDSRASREDRKPHERERLGVNGGFFVRIISTRPRCSLAGQFHGNPQNFPVSFSRRTAVTHRRALQTEIRIVAAPIVDGRIQFWGFNPVVFHTLNLSGLQASGLAN